MWQFRFLKLFKIFWTIHLIFVALLFPNKICTTPLSKSHASFSTIVRILSNWSFFKTFWMFGPTNTPSFIFAFNIYGNNFRIKENLSPSRLKVFKKMFINPKLIWGGRNSMSTDATTGWLIRFLSTGFPDFRENHICT